MENKLKGGKSDGMTIEDIAKKHKMDVDLLKIQLKNGIEVETEHSKDKEMAKEIAMDHLFEFPDYYIKLKKMEKDTSKKTETKEAIGADASGSYEAPFSGTILKKDIHKLHNFKSKEQEVKEVTGAGVSAGAMYDAPIGHGKVSPMDKKNKPRDPLKIDNPRTASITAAPTKDMKAVQKGFPRFGGPEGKFVEIDKKCKTYPYCDQGASSDKAFGKSTPIKLTEAHALKFYESKELQEAIQEAAKKFGLSVKNVQKMVLSKIISEELPKGMFGWGDEGEKATLKAMRSWTDKGIKVKYNIKTKEPINITTDDDVELAKLKLIFYNHDVDFNVEKIKE
jgi:antitoxin component of RelBE/YafQ-DinJ toxin-antitoxin module